MLQIIPLQNHKTHVEFSKNLYENSFPEEERREFSQLIDIYKNHKLELNIIIQENQLVGILNQWKFDEVLYIEHLAIHPEYRNKKIATKLLEELSKKHKTIVLEVELPTDEVSRKRIAFYQRAGFCIEPYNYYQPPYRKGEKAIQMHIMTKTKTPIKKEEYQTIIDIIRKKVYEKFW
jgi:ribosomal protein S18 acetylase RimI-like enzyme